MLTWMSVSATTVDRLKVYLACACPPRQAYTPLLLYYIYDYDYSKEAHIGRHRHLELEAQERQQNVLLAVFVLLRSPYISVILETRSQDTRHR